MTEFVAMEHGGNVFLLPTLIDEKLFVNASRSDFVVLERVASVLRDAGRPAGVEPDPAHLRSSGRTSRSMGLDERVTVIAAGAADTPRQQAFAQGSRKEGAYRWMKGRLVEEPSATTVTVETVTLDGLAEAGIVDPATTGLLWFDCGRCENAALQSASAFLERRVPIVFTLLRDQFKGSGPLLSRLEETYERVVDLRSPRLSEPLSSWTPGFRPVADLAVLPEEDKKLTDVLVL